MSGTPVVLLSGSDLQRLLRPETTIAALRETYAALADSRGDQGRSVGFTVEGGSIHVKSGLLPGSHLHYELDCPNDGVSSPEGAIPLRVDAGAALLLDRRLWHSRSPNFGPHTRKVIWIGYAYRWLRPKDEMTVENLIANAYPVRRQLLGHASSANSAYDPEDADVPLRGWLAEHLPEDARWSPHHDRPQARPPLHGSRGKNTGRR